MSNGVLILYSMDIYSARDAATRGPVQQFPSDQQEAEPDHHHSRRPQANWPGRHRHVWPLQSTHRGTALFNWPIYNIFLGAFEMMCVRQKVGLY